MSSNTPILYGALDKNAAFGDYVRAAHSGANIGTNNGSWLLHPINAVQGATKGILGHVAGNETAGLQQQGVRFNKDPYGRIQNVNVGDTIKSVAGNFLGSASSGLGQVGQWMGDHKGMLLGGLGVLGGGMLLKHMLSSNSAPSAPIQPQMSGQSNMYNPYMRQGPMYINSPQMIGKEAQESWSPFKLPHSVASSMVNGIHIPGFGGSHSEDSGMSLSDYHPKYETDNPRLKRVLHDPKMRDYLTNLIKNVSVPH